MIIGAAGSWFLLDIAYYGTTIPSPLVLKSLNSHADALTNMVYTLLMVRSSAHGIAAGLGKVGAFIGAFAFPYLLETFHLPGAMAFAAVVSLLGLLLTLFTLPEPNQRSLEEVAGDHHVMTRYRQHTCSLPTEKCTKSS